MDTSFLSAGTDPILTCAEAMDFERSLLTDSGAEWDAMKQVGAALGKGIAFEYGLSRFRRKELHALVLVGKGHNGGDALLGLAELCRLGLIQGATLLFAAPEAELKVNTRRALGEFRDRDDCERVEYFPAEDEMATYLERIESALAGKRFDLCMDGFLGMQFHPPLRQVAKGLIHLANELCSCRLRVAVDVPSGVGDAVDKAAFRADVTFATGVGKAGLFLREAHNFTGSIRYLDVGFFDKASFRGKKEMLIKDSVLGPLRERRPATAEKRQFGHLMIVAGSRHMPGALAMCVMAALCSGVGLVTVVAPESRVAALSARYPEAMWVECSETPDGGLALENLYLIRRYMQRGTALLVGPGMGREPETIELARELVRQWKGPLLLDADALQTSVVEALRENEPSRAVLTPHAGEMKRLAGTADAKAWTEDLGCVLALKGANSRVYFGGNEYVNTSGNGVLSRGGSGDLLSGILGGLLANGAWSPEEVAVMSVYWHGKAADLLAYHCGQTAARTTQVIDCLSDALVEEDVWSSV
ncbi:MAG: NAD(P)H-hydrate dehydratase [Verrucomicrobiota bacterium]